jgi:thiol-disulfide isomerase/thioredoxin
VNIIKEASENNSKVIAYFTATWCGPCKTISPVFDNLSTQYGDASFIKIDIDVCKKVSQLMGISSVPTFHFYLGDKPIKQQTGANKTSLENTVRLFMQASGDQLQNMAKDSAQDASEKLVSEFIEGDVSVLLDQRTRCANTLPGFPYDNIFKEGDACLKSDCDAELLLQLGFTSLVSLKSIKITSPNDGSGPKSIKLILNQQNIGFDTAKADNKSFKIDLTPENLTPDAKPITLPIVQFKKVDTLTIFVASNQEDKPQTTISRLIIMGKKF